MMDSSLPRQENGRFRPGHSGNPAGPKPGGLSLVQRLAREHTPEAITALVLALAEPRERVAAATVLLDRGWGKAVQPITGADSQPLAIHFTWAPAHEEPVTVVIPANGEDKVIEGDAPKVTWANDGT